MTKGIICQTATVNYIFDTRMFHKECRSLAKAGYDVHLVAVHERDEVIDGVRVHALRPAPNRFARVLLWPWLAFRKIRNLTPRPNIIHFHDPGFLLVGLLLRLLGYAVVYDVHENQTESIMTKPYLPKIVAYPVAWLYRGVELFCTFFIPTVHVLDSIAKRYPKPTVTLRNFPFTENLPLLEKSKLNSPPRLIYVGSHITQDRGLFEMLKVCVELVHRGLEFELRLVGLIPEDVIPLVKEMIRNNNLDGRVTLVGVVPFGQALQEIRNSDIGLCLLHRMPNYLNSLPIKILEYMSYGLCVVATDIGAWREYVTDVGTGLMVPIENVGIISDALENLLRHPEKVLSMGQRGPEAVRERYSWEKESQKLITLYEQLM